MFKLRKKFLNTMILITIYMELWMFSNIIIIIIIEISFSNVNYNKRGLTFKMWKLRDVKLDKHRGQFILDYLEPDEQEIYNLSDYAVFWVGLQGTKYVFKICAVNE